MNHDREMHDRALMEKEMFSHAAQNPSPAATEELAAEADGQGCALCDGSGCADCQDDDDLNNDEADKSERAPLTPRELELLGQQRLRAAQGDGQSCSLCGYDHFEAMRRALTQIFDYTGRDFQAIKNTAYMALPTTRCLTARAALAAVVHNEEK